MPHRRVEARAQDGERVVADLDQLGGAPATELATGEPALGGDVDVGEVVDAGRSLRDTGSRLTAGLVDEPGRWSRQRRGPSWATTPGPRTRASSRRTRDEHDVGLGVAPVDAHNVLRHAAANCGRNRVRLEQGVEHGHGDVPLADQRVREQCPQRDLNVAGVRGLYGQFLVSGDRLHETEHFRRERRTRPGGRRRGRRAPASRPRRRPAGRRSYRCCAGRRSDARRRR